MISVRNTFSSPLTQELLCSWQDLIIADPFKRKHMEIGKWRTSTEPMQIVSGYVGKESIHFQAPPSSIVETEMKKFIQWYNQTMPGSSSHAIPGPVRAAIAHLYFETIHPFSDGNGRVGRAISEKAPSEDLGRPVLLSLSCTIYKSKKEYYAALAQVSRCEMNITPWIEYFVKTVYQAQLDSVEQFSFVLKKAKFWMKYQGALNMRQEKVLSTMFKVGPLGFEGGMTAQKYMGITGCSKATATRDLVDLVEQGCIRKMQGGGRNIKYEIN